MSLKHEEWKFKKGNFNTFNDPVERGKYINTPLCCRLFLFMLSFKYFVQSYYP